MGSKIDHGGREIETLSFNLIEAKCVSDPPNNVGMCGEGLSPTNRRRVSKAPEKTPGGGRKLSVSSTSSLLL